MSGPATREPALKKCPICGRPTLVEDPPTAGQYTILQDWRCLSCRASGVTSTRKP